MIRRAWIIFAFVYAPGVHASCIVQIDQIDWLFKENNHGFGEANVQILHDITTETLKERGYQSVYDASETSPSHELVLKYTHSNVKASASKPGPARHQVTMVWSNKKTSKSTPVVLASLPIKRGPARTLQEAKEVLFDLAEEHYFTALKKIPKCPSSD